jgi:hypothetical protein
MKIYLSKPRYHWVSPYTVLEKVLFWLDWEKISYDTPWVEKWAERIMPFSKGWQKFMDFIHPEVNFIKVDYWDVWSMDHTLSPIILPMLKQLKEVKHGSGHVDDEDVPDELKSTSAPPKENEWDTDDNWHKRWDYVLDEMIWAFEQLSDDNHEDKFWHERGEIDWEEMKRPFPEGETTREVKWKSESKVDWDGMKEHNKRINNGTRLFGKYYRGLWD